MPNCGVLCHVTLAAAGSIELVSGNLGNGGISLDNIKGKWSQTLSLWWLWCTAWCEGGYTIAGDSTEFACASDGARQRDEQLGIGASADEA